MPKKKLTKMEALILCRRHWMWMKKHASVYKSDYFDAIGLDEDDRPHSDCWACEYMEKVDKDACTNNCIVDWDGPNSWEHGCSSNPDSAWNHWLQSYGKKEKRIACGRILWRIEKSIKKLREETDAKG